MPVLDWQIIVKTMIRFCTFRFLGRLDKPLGHPGIAIATKTDNPIPVKVFASRKTKV